jgi:hypothetical protein
MIVADLRAFRFGSFLQMKVSGGLQHARQAAPLYGKTADLRVTYVPTCRVTRHSCHFQDCLPLGLPLM